MINSTAPKLDWAPSSGLAGVLYSQDRQRHEELMSLNALLQQYDLARKSAELETYNLDFPMRGAEREQKISKAGLDTLLNQTQTTPEFATAKARGLMGEFGLNEAKGREALGTVESKIGAENVGNKIKAMEGAIQFLDVMEGQLKTIAENDPMGTNYLQFRNSLPNEIKNQLPSTYNPQIISNIEQMKGKLVDSIKQRQTLQAQREKDVAHMEREKEQTLRSFGTAKIQAKAYQDHQKLNEQQRYVQLKTKLANGGISEEEMGELIMSHSQAIAKHPEVAAYLKSMEYIMAEKPEQKGAVEESLRNVQEKLWNISTQGVPKLQERNPYRKKASNFSPTDMDWINRAQRANPSMPLEKIIEEGIKRGKIKKPQ